MLWKRHILTIILLGSLLLSQTKENELIIEKRETHKVSFSFNFSNEALDDQATQYRSENQFGYPTFNYLIEIDEGLDYTLNHLIIKSNTSQEFDNKNNFTQGIAKTESLPHNTKQAYISNSFIKNNKEYLQLTINPIQVENNELIISEDIGIEIISSKNIKNLKILSVSDSMVLLNRENNNTDLPVLLIIAPDGDNLFNLITPLINWKKLKGYVVHYYSLSEAGYTALEIKDFIQNAYDNWEKPPNYLCIIGDADGPFAVPTFNENLSIYNGESDHPYTLLDGDDNISDISVGRLSIRSLSHFATIINKIINYEQYPHISDINWFQRALCVGDPSISGSSTVITNQIIAELMIQNDFDEVMEVYQYPFVNQIENIINSGVSFYNYRGFSGVSGWQKDDADNLVNGYMLPVVSVITCDTGSFLEDEESISENFLRTGSISIPRGGVAAIGMSTQGTHTMFNNCLDYALYHALFAENIETLGDVINYAKNTLWLNYPHNPNNYVNIFSHWINLMGDPTLSVWTKTPQPLELESEDTIFWGQNYINLTTNSSEDLIDGVKITLTDSNFNLIASGISDEDGNIALNWQVEDAPVGTYNIVATKHNYIPYRKDLIIEEGTTSLNILDIEITDQNLDSNINPEDNIVINFKIKNYGSDSINNLMGEIVLNDESVSITTPNFIIENTILSNSLSDIITIQGTISDNIFKKEIAAEIVLTYENELWVFPISFIINAPDIDIVGLTTSDNQSFLIPNMDNHVNFIFSNHGSITSSPMLVNFSTNHPFINLALQNINLPSIIAGEEYVELTPINISVNYQAYSGLQIPITVTFINDNNIVASKIFQIYIGEVGSNDPMGPDTYGYYIYDFNDLSYSSVPIYNWIEIDPYLAGLGTILIDLDDNGENQDDVTFVNLPFDFQFYGELYEQISISTNGWLKPGLTNQSSFRNWRLPGPGGPSPMIAAFWDDLETDSGRICVDYNAGNHQYIVEWSQVENGFDGSSETFQIIIYDQDYYPTVTGDNIIKIQYKEFNNVNSGHYDIYNQWHGNYASIGIENEYGNVGLEYTWNNEYPLTSSMLSNESSILITTNPPAILNQMLGDMNQDSILDILDIVTMIQVIIYNNNEIGILIGDINQDSSLDILDVVLLVNTILDF